MSDTHLHLIIKMYGYIIHCVSLPKPKMGHFLWYWSNSYLAKQPAFTLNKYMYYRIKFWNSDLYLGKVTYENQIFNKFRLFTWIWILISLLGYCTIRLEKSDLSDHNTFLFSLLCKSFFLNFNKLKSVPLLCIKCQTKSVLVFQSKIRILITQN